MSGKMGSKIVPIAAAAAFMFVALGNAVAEEFILEMAIEGVVNVTEDDPDTDELENVMAIGLDADASDDFDTLDEKNEREDELSPPEGPGLMNYAGIQNQDANLVLLRDIRNADTASQTWLLEVEHGETDTPITLWWPTAPDVSDDTELNLEPLHEEDKGPWDLTVARNQNNEITLSDSEYKITYGAPQEGSIEVILQPEEEELVRNSGSWTLNGPMDELPVTRSGSEVVSGLDPADNYSVEFHDVNAAWETPSDENGIEVQSNHNTKVTGTYEKIPAELNVSTDKVTTVEGDSSSIEFELGAEPVDNVNIQNIEVNATDVATLDKTSLTFTPDNWAETQSIVVTGVDDDIKNEGNGRSFTVSYSVSSNDQRYDDLPSGQIDGFTIDDDRAGLVLERSTNNKTDEGGGTAQFTVNLNTTPSKDVTVNVASQNQSEGRVDTSSITFNSGQSPSAQTVTVTGQDDEDVDGDTSYRVICNASSSDDAYNGLTRALGFVNEDNDNPNPADADLVLIPNDSLAFGMLYEGGNSRTKTVTVFNKGGEDVSLHAQTSSMSRADDFTVGTNDFTLKAGEGKQLEVTASPKEKADGSPAKAALLITRQDQNPILGALALTSITIPPPTGGTLSIEPDQIVVDPSGDRESIEFEVVLDADVRFGEMSVDVDIPFDFSLTDVETNTDATSGWSFSYRGTDSGVSLFYTDPDADTDGGGASSGENTLVTVTGTVKTEGNTDVSDPISISSANAAAADGTQYQIEWDSDTDETRTTRASGGSFGTDDSDLAITDKISLATLDITEDGKLNMTDVILIYRGTISSITKGDPSKIAPESWGATSEQKAAFNDKVNTLFDNAELDVSGDDNVNMTDLILIYRWAISSITKGNVEEITPESWGATSEQKQMFKENVQGAMP